MIEVYGNVTYFSLELQEDSRTFLRVGTKDGVTWWACVMQRYRGRLRCVYKSRKPLPGYISAMLQARRNVK